MKKCKRCQQEKPASEFYGSTSNKDGLASYCRKCENIKKSKRKGLEWAVEGYQSEREHFNATLEHLSQFIPDFVEDKEATRKRILAQRKKPLK